MTELRNPATVDDFLKEGCGRCPLGSTPACKVNDWQAELRALRDLLLQTELTEAVKWGAPCYTFEKHNVLMLSALKDRCVIGFFKGALLKDAHGILTKPGENTQAARQISFESVAQIAELAPILRAYVDEAIAIERAGQKVAFKSTAEYALPEELERAFATDEALKTAFSALTPGRQRGYLLFFSAPKQAKTREARIDKCRAQILAGKGLHDYQ